MSLRGLFIRLSIVATVFFLVAAKPAPPAPAAYKGAIVIDAATGQTLFEDKADIISPPASVTKLMTFLIISDAIKGGSVNLRTPVTVTAEAAKTGGSQVYLAEKEVFPVEELLYALMISSANDAATALAIHLAGSKEAFVARMNARARELGMTRTTFRSPHGLPPATRKLADGDLTTPRDLATLSLHLVKHTDVLTYASVEKRDFRPGPKHIAMDNHNNLLGKVRGVDGLKTGFTLGAGYCLSATALREGRRVIVVAMGSPTAQSRDLRVAELIAEGFAKLPASSLFSSDNPVSPFEAAPPPASARAAEIPPTAPAEPLPTVRFPKFVPKKN